MPSTVVNLTTPVEMFAELPPIRSVTVKEPTGRMYIELGEPRILARNADGTLFWFEDKAAIAGYLARCIDHDNGSAVLNLLGIADVRAVKAALFDFFSETPANPASAPGTAASTPSTSAP